MHWFLIHHHFIASVPWHNRLSKHIHIWYNIFFIFNDFILILQLWKLLHKTSVLFHTWICCIYVLGFILLVFWGACIALKTPCLHSKLLIFSIGQIHKKIKSEHDWWIFGGLGKDFFPLYSKQILLLLEKGLNPFNQGQSFFYAYI